MFKTARKDLEGRYFRYNVEQGLQGIGLDEWNHFDRMDAATQEYLNDLSDELGNCVERLTRIGGNLS